MNQGPVTPGLESGTDLTSGVSHRASNLPGGHRRWRLKDGHRSDDLRASDYPPLVQRLLANRGITTTTEARAFLDGAPAGPSDPFSLPNMTAAVERVRAALRSDELVAVFGDFDVDGVTAAALLTEGLASLGGRAMAYLPDRFREGYGLNVGAVEDLRRQGASLLITVDCGTSSLDEIDLARKLGMDVVVLDHHTVPERLPDTSALVNPHLPQYQGPYEQLAAVGLAYQLMRALHDALGRPIEPERWLDLVALGTVVDMAPLVHENRELVRRGLRILSQAERPGLRALMAVAGVEPSAVDSEALSFALGPRLNAAGRISHARLAYDLLLEREEGTAVELARHLNDLNRERQSQTKAALELAHDLLEAEDDDVPLVMLGHPSFSSGIVGLVAARLAQDRYRPAVVYEQGESISRASARSVPEFDIVGALRSCGGLFQRFGGHRQAAGFTADNERLPEIKRSLQAHAGEALAGLELVPSIQVDAAFPLQALRGEEMRWLARFAPHGIGNPRPVLLSRDVTLVEASPVGAPDAGHFRLKLRDGPISWPGIAFGLGNRQLGTSNSAPTTPVPPDGSRVDVVYSFSADRRGGDRLELEVLDIRPSTADTP